MDNRFSGKYISIVGDSISTFEGYLPNGYPTFYSHRGSLITGINSSHDTWWGQVIKRLGAKLLINNSWSGSYVCKAEDIQIESYGCSDSRTTSLGTNDLSPDHIIIYMGTNDRGAGFPLTGKNKSDLSIIENAYYTMLEKIKKSYPSAEIWCCTFPITTCTRDPYFEFPITQMGVPMEKYGELIKSVANSHSCHIIDLWDDNELCDTIDGLHPNFNGMNMIANKVIYTMMKTNESKLGKNLFLLSAPSATGKNTVFDLLKERIPSLKRVITATTRLPRKNETNGVDYHFLSEDEFVKKSRDGGFVEENKYDEHYYGTPIDEIVSSSQDTPLFIIIDTNGMKKVVEKYPNATSIFLMPPSIDELERRIRSRGDNTQDEIERRIAQAKNEIACSESYDHIVVNDDLNECVDRLVNIVENKIPSVKKNYK